MKLDVIEIQVKDFNKSLIWYKNLFKPVHEEQNFAMFNTGRATLALWKGKKNRITLYFRSGDIEKMHSKMKKKNIEVSSIQKVHWGRRFSFIDLEGNKYFVYEELKK